MGIRIDGSALAELHATHLRGALVEVWRKPKIVSFCNTEDEPSVKYTSMKAQKAEEVGIEFKVEEYDTSTEQLILAEKIRQYNSDPTVDGIMVQLPLPLDLVVFQTDLLELIDPHKDVDGLTEAGQQFFMPATVKSVISILQAEVSDWEKKRIGLVGSEGEVGKPLAEVLIKKGVQDIILIDIEQGNLDKDLLKCDIIISATGKENLIKPEMIKEGSVLIDVGLGDFDPACYDKASKYTAKYKGVGPMTVISLMENVLESFQSWQQLQKKPQ